MIIIIIEKVRPTGRCSDRMDKERTERQYHDRYQTSLNSDWKPSKGLPCKNGKC